MRSIVFYTCFFMYSTSLAPAYSGGTGTIENPYQIATSQDLMGLGETPEDSDRHFVLTADIDLSNRIFDRAVIASDTNDSTYWFEGTPFSGHFDGQGHVIRNLHLRGRNYLGLFGQLGSDGLISNLGVEVIDIEGTSVCVGGLVGENHGSILSSYCTGVIKGDHYVGGLVGKNHGSVLSSYSTGRVTGDHSIGGLVGNNGYYGIISNCYHSTGTATGTHHVGGLIGFNNGGNVSKSYSTGEVTGTYIVGGIVGGNHYTAPL